MIKFLALFLLLTINTVAADSFDAGALQGLGDTRYHLFESKTLGHPLHIYVRVPESPEQNPEQTFPTVYLLDGGVNFPLLSSYYHYLRISEELPEMLLVGISYGSDTFDGGNYQFLSRCDKSDLITELILFMCLSLCDTTGKGLVQAIDFIFVGALLCQHSFIKVEIFLMCR
jgi:hypothetical protein